MHSNGISPLVNRFVPGGIEQRPDVLDVSSQRSTREFHGCLKALSRGRRIRIVDGIVGQRRCDLAGQKTRITAEPGKGVGKLEGAEESLICRRSKVRGRSGERVIQSKTCKRPDRIAAKQGEPSAFLAK